MVGGTGPPLLLLHGHPQTRSIWHFEPIGEWRRVARDVEGEALPCGHYIAEEAPEQLLARALPFFN